MSLGKADLKAETLSAFSWLQAGGITGEHIRSKDWSQTPVGPIEAWPQTLTTALSICLLSKQPSFVWWKTEPDNLTIFYNDAYIPIAAAKHPHQIGADPRSPEGWAEMWQYLKPLVDNVFINRTATWNENLFLPIYRSPDLLEEAYWSFSYSPIITSEGAEVAGMYCSTIETTKQVLADRRLKLLRNLATGSGLSTDADVAAHAGEQFAENLQDLPFALLYLVADDGEQAHLCSTSNVEGESAINPRSLPLIALNEQCAWPVAEVYSTGRMTRLGGLRKKFTDALPMRPWEEPGDEAVILPIASPTSDDPIGFLIVGLSPRLRFDREYERFLKLMAGHLSTNITNARTVKAERERAEALAEIDRAKTAFFNNVSHEFRTPLTLMLGPLEDVLANNSDPGCRRQLELVHRNGLRLLKLTNTLLEFARIEAGRAQAVYVPTDLPALTLDLGSVFRSTIEKAGLKFSVNCAALDEPAFIDRDMWEKIVLNLLSNAFKFTLQGEIEVRLTQTSEHFVLAVQDSGGGIPAHEVPNLFKRFHRVAAAHGRTLEGSGIGLALVQELVKLHGGDVSVESEIGKGSVFMVRIPRGHGHLPNGQISASGAGPMIAQASPFVREASLWLSEMVTEQAHFEAADAFVPHIAEEQSNQRAYILLADDNADMRDYVRRLLSPRYHVEVAHDGASALAAIQRRKPDLLLADVMMPRLDGLQLLARLRSENQTSTLPVILLSARAGEESRVEGMHSGADDYLIKPFSARELLARVEAHVKMARFRDESARTLLASEERFRAFVTATSDVVYRMSPDWGEMRFLEGKDFIASTDSPSEGWLQKYIHTDDQMRVMTAIGEAVSSKTPFDLEHSVIRIDGSIGWTHSRAIPVFNADDEIVEWFGAARDITERKRAEETQRLLVGELNHRVKNTLASVQSIAQNMLRRMKDPAEFVPAFSGRIQSLSRVHSILSRTTWQGADLYELVRDQLLQGSVDEARLTTVGPAVRLEPQIALHMALMLHELGTNAIKYGALSLPEGRVNIEWTLDDGSLCLCWTERGGPQVSGPSPRGFGTTLIERSAKGLGGTARLTMQAEGVIWKITLPLPQSDQADHARQKPVSPDQIASRQKPGIRLSQEMTKLKGRRFLIVEDEPLVAIDIESTLQEAGAEVVGPAGNAQEALRLIESTAFDGALLDANLGGNPVEEIAHALTRRKAPFIFVTGYGRESLPPAFVQAPMLGKPFNQQQLIQAAVQLLTPDRSVTRLRS